MAVMRRLSLNLTLLLVAHLMSAQTNERSEDRTYIQKAESEWAESVTNHDCAVLERILADEFVGVDVDGTHYSKADTANDCKTKPSKFEFNHLDKVEIRFFQDMAVAQGSESWKLKRGTAGKFVWTDTWLKRNGKWQIVAAEDLIPVPSPFNDATQ